LYILQIFDIKHTDSSEKTEERVTILAPALCVAGSKIITKKLGGFLDRHNRHISFLLGSPYTVRIVIHIKLTALRKQDEDSSCAPITQAPFTSVHE
jgi:hypothetical protein